MTTIIDGDNLILGRLAAHVAKRLLIGERIVIINAEKIAISGDPRFVVQRYAKRRLMKDKADPEHSPKWPRRPDLLVKRVIRGMLPYGDKSSRGRNAFHRLRVYLGVPEEFKESTKMPDISAAKLRHDYTTVSELCKQLGYSGA
jgi:large subunit ribosomal protein L13